MPSLEQTKTKSSLTAIHSYELSRLELLPLATMIAISSELTAAIHTLRISKEYADETFHRNQAAYYSNLKINFDEHIFACYILHNGPPRIY
jgi:hypothetical protein